MSPLGRYAEGVAAIVALAIIATWLVTMLLGGQPQDRLHDAVLLALSYIFVKGAPASAESIHRAVSRAQADLASAQVEVAHAIEKAANGHRHAGGSGGQDEPDPPPK